MTRQNVVDRIQEIETSKHNALVDRIAQALISIDDQERLLYKQLDSLEERRDAILELTERDHLNEEEVSKTLYSGGLTTGVITMNGNSQLSSWAYGDATRINVDNIAVTSF